MRIQSALSKGSMGISLVQQPHRKSSRSIGSGNTLLKVSTLSFTDDPELGWMNNYTKGIYVTEDVTCDGLKTKLSHTFLRGTPKDKVEMVKEICASSSLYACDVSAPPRLIPPTENPLTLLHNYPFLRIIFSQKTPLTDSLSFDSSSSLLKEGVLCHGILGVLPLLSCSFLIIAREISSVGRLPIPGIDPEVFFVEEVDLIPIPPQVPLAPDLVTLSFLTRSLLRIASHPLFSFLTRLTGGH